MLRASNGISRLALSYQTDIKAIILTEISLKLLVKYLFSTLLLNNFHNEFIVAAIN